MVGYKIVTVQIVTQFPGPYVLCDYKRNHDLLDLLFNRYQLQIIVVHKSIDVVTDGMNTHHALVPARSVLMQVSLLEVSTKEWY